MARHGGGGDPAGGGGPVEPDALGSVGAVQVVEVIVSEVGADLDEQGAEQGEGPGTGIEYAMIGGEASGQQDRRDGGTEGLGSGGENPGVGGGHSERYAAGRTPRSEKRFQTRKEGPV